MTTQILRLTFEEIMYVEALLCVALGGVEEGSMKSKKFKILSGVQKKMDEALKQADKDGLIDMSGIKL